MKLSVNIITFIIKLTNLMLLISQRLHKVTKGGINKLIFKSGGRTTIIDVTIFYSHTYAVH